MTNKATILAGYSVEEQALIERVYSKINSTNKKAFLAIIRANELENGWARVNIEDFSKATHVSQTSIGRALGTMQKHGIIAIRKYRLKGTNALRNEYKINTPDEIITLYKNQ